MKKCFSFAFCIILIFSFGFTVLAQSEEISYAAQYSLLTPASVAYPDDGIKLTDGIYGTHPENADGYYASNAYVGFNKNDIDENGNFTIVLDLGKEYDNLTQFTIGYLCEIHANIYAPKKVEFSVSSQRNGNYTQVGSLITTPEDENTAASYAKNLTVAPVKGRYVLITITPGDYEGKVDTATIAPWTFIDEIAVHANKTLKSADATNDEGDKETMPPASTEDNANPDNGNNGDIPQTGDNSSILGFTLLSVAALAMGIALFVKIPGKRF